MREQRYITFRGQTSGAEIRTANFEGREHVVIPVIMLVGDEVIWAMNAPGPEFVPSEVIQKSAIEWSGRPCVGDHPKGEDGRPISANKAEVYEKVAFGRIDNPRYEDGKLRVEAWLDREKAEKVGPDAVRVIERARNKEVIEVSAGAWVEVLEREGKAPNGKSYVGVWQDIGSDHLALLPEGATGACSIEMGCGGPRVAELRAAKILYDSTIFSLRGAIVDRILGGIENV